MRGQRFFSIINGMVLSLGLAFACCPFASPAVAQKVASENGVLADLQISDDRALIRWRFLKLLASPLKEISGNLDGEPLGEPRLSEYPAYGDITRILVLIDPTGADRTASVNKQIAAALQLTQTVPAHVKIAFGAYAADTTVFTPRDFDQLVVTLASINAPNEKPDLLSALLNGIRLQAALPGQRKALFVFTDGHSDVPVKMDSTPDCTDCAGTVADLALRNGVSVNFILADSSRTKELDAMRLIADRSGGQVIEEANTIPFVARPLTLIDGGGSVVFPIPQRLVYFWQKDPTLHVTFDMGAQKVQLSSIAPQPRATAVETARYVATNHPYVAGGSGAGALALIAGAIFLRRRSRQPPPVPASAPEEEAERQPVFALLQNIGDGSSYPISSDQVTIGRADNNDLVIEDAAVSREHVLIWRDENGQFIIEGKGANGTFVNHLPIEKAELADRDLITIGDTTLQFVQPKA